MPLNMTKIAFGAENAADLRRRLEAYSTDREARLTTRYLPKRIAEMTGGSLYWIHSHAIIVRAEQAYWLDQNITGVPAIIFDQKFMVPGAQSAETFAGVIGKVLAKREAA